MSRKHAIFMVPPKNNLSAYTLYNTSFYTQAQYFYYFYGFRKIAKVASTSFEILCFLHHSLTAFEAPGRA